MLQHIKRIMQSEIILEQMLDGLHLVTHLKKNLRFANKFSIEGSKIEADQVTIRRNKSKSKKWIWGLSML